MSQSSLGTVGGGSHDTQEDHPSVRREHAERCLNQSAFKYTPRNFFADASSIPVLFPLGTPGVDRWSPALFHALSPVAARRLKVIIASAACGKIQRAFRGFLARKVACEVAMRYDVGAGFWRLPAETYFCDEYFALDGARAYDGACPALYCILPAPPHVDESHALDCVQSALRTVPPPAVGPRACSAYGRAACDLHDAAATLSLRFPDNLDFICGRLSGKARRKIVRHGLNFGAAWGPMGALSALEFTATSIQIFGRGWIARSAWRRMRFLFTWPLLCDLRTSRSTMSVKAFSTV